MRMIKSMIIAFSIYSRIPMPRFKWKEEDMRYNLCFLPLVGVVIGLAVYGGLYAADRFGLPLITRVCIVSLIPLVITGGFHVDGYMDVKDALKSYKGREEKLKILEDPHIGAFAVISLLIYALIWTGSLSVISDRGSKALYIFLSAVFVISRTGTAISSLLLKKAKDDGMLKNETYMAGKRELGILIAELILCVVFLGLFDICISVFMALVMAVFFIYYRYKTYKEFGGVSGDTAGYFVCVCELLEVFMLAVFCLIRS